jgi:dCTP deaminase
MSLLTQSAIQSEIQSGRIVIQPPLQLDQIQVASIDLHLGNIFRIYKENKEPINLVEETNYHDYTEEIIAETITILPQQTILGVTAETITLPNNIAGWLEGRSRFARMGLLIHISAGLIQPGVSNKQVLEITNLSPNPLILHAGVRICQLALQRCEGEASYNGKFNGQVKP